MKHLLLFLILNSFNLFAQKKVLYKGEKINSLDRHNQKQGLWKLFDEQNNLMISCEMKNDTLASDISYYKDDKLIISYKKINNYFLLYKGLDTLQAKLIKTPDNITTLVKMNGDEIDTTITNWFYRNGEINSMFYGGQIELGKFISKSINFKNTDHRVGKVKVELTIDANGFPTNIKVIEGNDEKLMNEAVRIVKAMPRWQPAHQRAMFVSTSFIIPFSFK